MVTFNAPINFEVAETALVAATADGVLLSYDGNGKLALATAAGAKYDAVLISEIVDAATFKDRYYIYTNIDFGPYVQIGEMVSVAKGVKQLTANGVACTPGAGIAKGAELEIGAGGKLVVKAAGVAVAVALEAIPSGATRTGSISFL